MDPARPALVDIPNNRRVSFGELDARICQLASALTAHGLSKGDRVGVLSKNCIEYFEIYYVGDEPLGDDYAALRAANSRGWRSVFSEDQDVVERLQRGRASPAFEGGVFSPAMDGPTHCFHKWAARGLADAASHTRGPAV